MTKKPKSTFNRIFSKSLLCAKCLMLCTWSLYPWGIMAQETKPSSCIEILAKQNPPDTSVAHSKIAPSAKISKK
jgi:hypothetical protein